MLLLVTSIFTLVDTLHAITFLGILSTLLVSAIALKQYDKGKKELSERTNVLGAKIVITTDLVLNLVFVVIAII